MYFARVLAPRVKCSGTPRASIFHLLTTRQHAQWQATPGAAGHRERGRRRARSSRSSSTITNDDDRDRRNHRRYVARLPQQSRAVPTGAGRHIGRRSARGGGCRAVAGLAGAGAGGAVPPSAGAGLGMREGARGAPQVERYGPGQTACRTRCFVIYAMFRPLCMCVCVDLE